MDFLSSADQYSGEVWKEIIEIEIMELTEFWVDGWKYYLDVNQPPTKRVKVVPPEREIPEYLYKYYNLSSYSLDAIKKNYLYAASRFELNDDFDCLEQLLDLEEMPDEVLIDFYKSWHSLDEIIENIDYFRKSYPDHKVTNYYGGFGVISLSENIYSQTMWAHYADSNHGFAVKFNIDNFHERMLGPYPVNYKENWTPIKLLDVHEALAFLYMTNIKSTHWKYENEWRYIGVRPNMSFPFSDENKAFIENRKFEYSKNAIKVIMLGSRFLNGTVKENTDRKRFIIEPKLCKKHGIEKHELLVFITDNNIKTNWMAPLEGSKTFELNTNPVEITRIDESLFEVKL